MNQQNSHDVVRRFVRATSVKTLCMGLALGTALFFFWSRQVAFGYIAGAAISVVYFNLMAADAYGLKEKSSGSAKKFFVIRYALRFVILFTAVALIATRTDFNIFAVFAGVLAVQTVFMAQRVYAMISIRKPMKV
jgi:hypothetical protein